MYVGVVVLIEKSLPPSLKEGEPRLKPQYLGSVIREMPSNKTLSSFVCHVSKKFICSLLDPDSAQRLTAAEAVADPVSFFLVYIDFLKSTVH